MKNNSDFILLQINDSLFPIGVYNHSYGLETYIQKELVNDYRSAYKYIKSNLETNFLYTELLSIYLAYNASKKGDISKLIQLDKKLNALKSPREIRVASQKLGSRFIKTLMGIDMIFNNNNFKLYADISKKFIPTHTVAYGVFCESTNIDINNAIKNFLYSYTSSTVTTCVKSIPLSQSDGQRLLYDLFNIFEGVLDILPTLGDDDLGLSCPGFDIRSMEHEVLYSRLYMS